MMNYKKIIQSREIRLKILELLSFIPDKMMIKLQYRMKTGRKLNLKNPQRFTEKLQWYKLNYKNPKMIKCVDKYDVREFVKENGLEDILIPCIGVYDSIDDINWSALPRQFVLKDTLGGGGSSVIIVKDKERVNIEYLKKKCSNWTSINAHVRGGGREWPYYCGKKHRIIIEEFLKSDDSKCGLIDYKFFCFNGKCYYIYVIADRDLGDKAGIGIYDSKFNRIKAYRVDEKPLEREITKPENFVEMIEVAQKLAAEFPEVRVDLYSVEGKTMFGEMTFFDGSGYMKFEPDDWDIEFGKFFKLDKYEDGE